jgi:glutamate 5-kinase
MGKLNLHERPASISGLQATAAIGQGILMQTYEKYFNQHHQPIAQILVTKDDFMNTTRYTNFKNTIETLIDWNIIPIINENDTVAVEEIKVGDNDTLAAHVALGINAELLIISTDVDGLYTKDPKESNRGKLVHVVEEVTAEVESWGSKGGKGFGGMYTKVKAAKKLAEAGVPTIIVNGMNGNMIQAAVEGKNVGTLFLPHRRLKK